MLFNSFQFASFFIIVYAAYVLSLRRRRTQNALLLLASYVFYGCWDWRFLGLIWLSTVIDYACGRLLDRHRCPADRPTAPGSDYRYSDRTRRAIVLVSVCANLGILGFFKYYDFFAAGAADLLTLIGLPLQPRLLHLVLPVGISFYTFQTLSYTIDVYGGRIAAERRPMDFALFVAFFPQLVAGPIVRAAEFLPQINRPRVLDARQCYQGAYLLLWGLFKKVVIADNVGLVADWAFNPGASPQGAAVLVGTYAFAVQIYCDFSGYSDMARGLAGLMGFRLPLNFNLPYFAANPSDFWRRWHISLSSWLRDYLYIPLGGSRRGPRRVLINLMLTMVLGGLWHGAAWTFVLWGAYHGLLLITHRLTSPWLKHVSEQWGGWRGAAWRCLRVVVFFHLVCLGWLIFRADTVLQVGRLLMALASSFRIHGSGIIIFAACAVPLVLVQSAQYIRNDLEIILRLRALWRGAVYTAMFYGLVVYGVRLEKPFIYFQF